MRILLLGFGKIAYMPYMNFYLEEFSKRDDLEVDLIYWERDETPDAQIPTIIHRAYKYTGHLEEQLSFWRKLKYFAGYRRLALRVLRKNRYDRIVLLHTTPGLTLIDHLVFHYKGKYLLDFRDVSYEYIALYRVLVGQLSKHACMTFVSSDAFRVFLPAKGQIYTVHNFSKEMLAHTRLRSACSRGRDVIRLRYWGLIRQVDVNCVLMDALGNDPRFELHYHGRMQQDGRDMVTYAAEKGYHNVFFHGPYLPKERYAFARETDLIHNIYNVDFTTGNAVGNKIYDGMVFGIPQLCTDGSYMGEIIRLYDLGLPVTPSDTQLADRIWEYYQNIDWEAFDASCAVALQDVLAEQEQAKAKLMEALL